MKRVLTQQSNYLLKLLSPALALGLAACAPVSKQPSLAELAASSRLPATTTIEAHLVDRNVKAQALMQKQAPFSAANFSTDGQSLVFASQGDAGIGLYISEYDAVTQQWATPVEVVSKQSNIVELPGEHFSSFTVTEKNEPSLADGTLVFLAQLSDGVKGLFYARKQEGQWQVHRIATTKNRVHAGGTDFFTAFKSPKIIANNIYFIAQSAQKAHLYRYNINTGLRTAIPTLTEQGDQLTDLERLSLSSHGSFALIANADGKSGVYAFTGYGYFRRLSPEPFQDSAKQTIAVQLGNMDYHRYGTQMVAVTTAHQKISADSLVPQSGVYINLPNFNSTAALFTWQKVSGFEFLNFKTPQLLSADRLGQGQASFVFSANTASAPRLMGIYQAQIQNRNIAVKPILVPGELLNQKRVLAVQLGDRSFNAKQNNLAVTVQFTDGEEGVYLLPLG